MHAAGHTLRFTHDAARRETERRLDGGLVLTESWDPQHRLVAQSLAVAQGTDPAAQAGGATRPRHSRSWTYRIDGHVIATDDDATGARQFELDNAGRVTAVHGANLSERYAYDAAGNLAGATWPTASDSDSVDAGCQGSREYSGTLIRRAGRTRYEHDASGRTILRQQKRLSGKPHTWHYTWNADDQLSSVITPDGTSWRYTYDPLGRRVAKQRLDPGGRVAEQIDFIWDGSVLAEQIHHRPDRPGAPLHHTVWDWQPGAIRPLTQAEFTTLRDAPQEVIDQRFYAVITDIVDAPTELVTPDGETAWRHRPALWGAAATGSLAGGAASGGSLASGTAAGGADCPLRFPGQYFDPETGAHYNYHRYYDPTTARYQSPDPLGLAPAPNPHAYVPNPHAQIDPFGLDPGTVTRSAADFAIDPNGNAVDLRPGHRPDNEFVLSGHGTIPTGDTSTATVPPGTTVHMYSQHGQTISDSLGNQIEYHGNATPYETFGPGQQVPDYFLSPPTGLNIMGYPVTVTKPTRLSELLRPNQGNVHWAACREIYP